MLHPSERTRRAVSPIRFAVLVTLAMSASRSHAGTKPASSQDAAVATTPKSTSPAHAVPFAGDNPGASFSVDMVVTSDDQTIRTKRTVSGPRTRMDVEAEGQTMSVIALGDDANTTWMLMHDQKQAMKFSMKAMKEHLPEGASPESETLDPADGQVKHLGTERLNGKTADKYEVSAEGGKALLWAESGTHLPLRMEFQGATVSFENYRFGPQPAALFAPPKDYDVQDLDELMAESGMSLEGASGLAGAMGGSIAELMAGQMGGGYGGALGGTLGTALGGPLGGMVGAFVGQHLGQKIGSSGAGAVLPGK